LVLQGLRRVETIEEILVKVSELSLLNIRLHDLRQLGNREHHNKPVWRIQIFGDEIIDIYDLITRLLTYSTDDVAVIELEQNLLLTRQKIALEVFRLPNLVHDLNDVAIVVKTFFSPFKNGLNVNHAFVVEAFATQELKDRT
jgi:hypothetical protein